jgi:hypothetical protein
MPLESSLSFICCPEVSPGEVSLPAVPVFTQLPVATQLLAKLPFQLKVLEP